jgi:hypothetical protein
MRISRLLAALAALAIITAPALANDISNSTWNEQDNSNTAAPPAGWPSGTMLPNAVEPAARAILGAVKRWYDHANATATSGGSANAQTLTYSISPAAYVAGDEYVFIPNFTNTGATTLNVNSLGAESIKIGTNALNGGELQAGEPTVVFWDGTEFELLTTPARIGGDYSLNLGGNLTTGGALTTTGTGAATLAFPNTSATYTYPGASQTLASLAGSETLTNKGINCASNTCTNWPLGSVTGSLAASYVTGSTAGSTPAAGEIGEVAAASVSSGSAVSLSNATPKTIVSRSLTAGNWQCDGDVGFVSGGTISELESGISTTNNTFPNFPPGPVNLLTSGITPSESNIQPTGIAHLSLSSSGTAYLIAEATFGTSMTAYGQLTCVRQP